MFGLMRMMLGVPMESSQRPVSICVFCRISTTALSIFVLCSNSSTSIE